MKHGALYFACSMDGVLGYGARRYRADAERSQLNVAALPLTERITR